MPPAGADGVMVQVPMVFIVTVVPDTVQTLGVELAKVSVVPAESDPAGRVKVPPFVHTSLAGGDQVMVWLAPLIVMLLGEPTVST